MQQSCYITIQVYGIPKSLVLHMHWSYQLKKDAAALETFRKH